MKITDVKTYLVNANERTTAERPRGRNWLFVKVFTDAGVTGVGEGGGWPFLVAKGIDELKYFLVGENPFEIERLWLRLYDVLHGHGVDRCRSWRHHQRHRLCAVGHQRQGAGGACLRVAGGQIPRRHPGIRPCQHA